MIAVAILLTLTAPVFAEDAAPRDVIFETKVSPLLKARCGGCHGDDERKSGLAISSVASLVAGGATRGAAIVPGHPEESVLIKMVAGRLKPQMPLKGEPLAPEDVALLESWIRHLTSPPPALRNETANWWAVQKIRDPELPEIRQSTRALHPIDRFVLAELEKSGLEPAPEASRPVLLRRAFFDLVGMPPTPQEAREFLDDKSSNSYERLLDRLLADPRYGERWGRHWLDVVRYADSGGSEYDREFSHLWRYRDYVIRSFNDDKTYDRFIIEQLAGDEIDSPTSQSRVALGFLRLSPEHGSPNKDVNRQLLLNELTSSVASVFLGVTLGCAQCHDHKYDPMTQRDFYRLQAFFVGARMETADVPFEAHETERWAALRQAAEQHLSQTQKRSADLETEFLSRLKDLLISEGQTPDAAAKQATKAELDRRLALAEPEAAGAQGTATVRRFTAEDRVSLTRLRNDVVEAALDGVFEKGAARRRVDRYLPRAHVVANTTQDYFANVPHLPVAFVRIRGEVDRLGEMVRPGFLSAVIGSHDPATPRTDKFGNLEKFRIGLAEWITSRDNPLASRVMVNRIWQNHFGQGLVRTANNFGRNGTPPTHPLLLDWLAAQFIENRWSVKSMHRLIMTSATYRQSSDVHSLAAEQADPTNRLLWRMNRRRLEGEAIRDSILAVSGRLNLEMGGPGIYPPLPDGMDDRTYYKHSRFWEPSDGPDSLRRSVYIFNRRQLDFPLLAALDAPVFSSPNEQRAVSTTPLQALLLLNGRLVNDEASCFAQRVAAVAGADRAAQIRIAYQLALTRDPTDDELHDALKFLAGEPGPGGLVGLCRVLFNLNEFVYVD
ncbi:MAG: PSD1 domain-containing protein [Planctomycetia bacterium]|nr:PSD1 domain-containing protein [Planctomycetia bacterium]